MYIIWDIQTNIQVAAWNYKSFIAKAFDGNTLKMKTTNPIQVIKDKEESFQLFPDETCTLVLHASLFACLIGLEIKANVP